MKAAFILAATLLSTSAFAGESYHCIGKDEKGKRAVIELAFESDKKVTVTDYEGSDIELDLDKVTSKGKVFADYGYDGYGGYVALTVPKGFTISGSNAAEEFKAQYRQEVYSEIGHVATVKFTGSCERLDD